MHNRSGGNPLKGRNLSTLVGHDRSTSHWKGLLGELTTPGIRKKESKRAGRFQGLRDSNGKGGERNGVFGRELLRKSTAGTGIGATASIVSSNQVPSTLLMQITGD